MTAQEIFDKVWQHFVVDGNPRSISETGSICAYRGYQGAKCAFGLFIPDDKYDESMEGRSVSNNYFDDLLRELNLIKHRDLLTDLQNAHDTAYSVFDMQGNLARTGRKYNLLVPNSPGAASING